ncbi:MAG TPA: ABC transporter permease [Edaphocola sp.]|nr:ABC transporter permease [Edaphocola sp.]
MQHQSYSQFKAFKAITIAALRSISKSPSSVIFTIAFPLIFILVFGFIGGNGRSGINVAFSPGSDTASLLAKQIGQQATLKFVPYRDSADLFNKIEKGKINVLLDVQVPGKAGDAAYRITLKALPAALNQSNRLKMELQQIIASQDPVVHDRLARLADIRQASINKKEFKTIDFILPGQLGFALLAASVFGTAFVFFSLRQGLVLKRFFATPVRREYILLGEGTARMIFQLFGAILIILIGRFFLGYTLVHGWITVVNMLILSALGILVFMSFGFIISGLSRSESSIPPLSNILTLPQFLLAGTFFPVSDFPGWLQPISKALPLTYLNDALRAVAFDGQSLWGVKLDLAVLLLWGIAGYFIAGKLFKWE